MDFEFGFGESGDYLGWAGNGIWIGDFEDCFSRQAYLNFRDLIKVQVFNLCVIGIGI